jgi:hypothetical protein
MEALQKISAVQPSRLQGFAPDIQQIARWMKPTISNV